MIITGKESRKQTKGKYKVSISGLDKDMLDWQFSALWYWVRNSEERVGWHWRKRDYFSLEKNTYVVVVVDWSSFKCKGETIKLTLCTEKEGSGFLLNSPLLRVSPASLNFWPWISQDKVRSLLTLEPLNTTSKMNLEVSQKEVCPLISNGDEKSCYCFSFL